MQLAPRVGLEPTTTRLTAECSTIELSRIILNSYTFKISHRPEGPSPFYFKQCFPTPLPSQRLLLSWSSLRPISDGQLHALLHFHLRPIYLVLFKGSYPFRVGRPILRGASRLDAFSAYPVRAWLLCHAAGPATDTPVARPSRSSRTKDGSSQTSCARAG